MGIPLLLPTHQPFGSLIAMIYFTQVGRYTLAYGLGPLAAVMQISFHGIWKNVPCHIGGSTLWWRLRGWVWAQ